MDDVEVLQSIAPAREALKSAIGEVVVGQQEVVDLMLTALFSNGHCLFVGVPGLAKTLLVRTVAETLGVSFGRIQFTPDLMPADITGTEVLDTDRETGKRQFRFVHGPVFTNLLLADEINRTPPKTQAALLQAMQERAVTAAGTTMALEDPFLVFATQNPIEQEGTYPLPEAQQDRFMFSIQVGYPSVQEEEEIVRRTTVGALPQARQVLTKEQLLACQRVIRSMPISDEVVRYAVKLTGATRGESGFESSKWLRWGAGPRASQYLAMGARTWAVLHGRDVPVVDDVRKVASAVLGHRVVLSFEAEAAGMSAPMVIERLVSEVG